MQYRLRTLLILLTVGPPMLAGAWPAIEHCMQRRSCSDHLKQIGIRLHNYRATTVWPMLSDGESSEATTDD